jgi:hypothetical protein
MYPEDSPDETDWRSEEWIDEIKSPYLTRDELDDQMDRQQCQGAFSTR